MGNSDNTKGKPRRTRGTPAYRYRNKFALTCIGLGSLVFAAWACTPIFQNLNNRMCDLLLRPCEEEIDRRYLFNFPKPLPSREIEKSIAEGKEILSQR